MKAYPIPLPVDGLMAKAREITGIDIVDDDVFEPLSVMVKSFNEESCLHEPGALAMQKKLIRLLSNRLRMKRDYQNHPEIAEQVIKAPIIICGMARTGSTKTQKLLSASGDFNWLPFWQVHNPSLFTGSRSESTQPRIDDSVEFCEWFDEVSPDTKYAHAMEAMEPDEESYILEHSFRTTCFIGWCESPSYMEWLMKQDMSLQFEYLLDSLKYLQWQGLQSPDKRWVLKCPLYFGMEPILLKFFPDAQLIMTHRHPAETTPSACRLLETFHEPFTKAPIDYNGYLVGSAAQMNQHLAIRDSRSDIEFLDLNFLEVVKSVDEVAKKVYRYCGVELTDESLQRFINWDKNNPKDKKGVHKYSLADFNFTEAMVNEAFAPYIQLLKSLFGEDLKSSAR